MFNTYPDVLTRLEKIKSQSTLGVMGDFSLLSLKSDLINWMTDINRKNGTIDVETPLMLEDITREM